MNGDKYKPIITQYKEAKTAKERQDCLFTIVCMIANNHLHDIEENQQRLDAKIKKVFLMGGAILLAILFSDQISLTAIIGLVARVLG